MKFQPIFLKKFSSRLNIYKLKQFLLGFRIIQSLIDNILHAKNVEIEKLMGIIGIFKEIRYHRVSSIAIASILKVIVFQLYVILKTHNSIYKLK